jgi:hypothetical protein
MGKAERLTEAILKSMGKEGDPIGILIEAVLEKEFKSYDDLLRAFKTSILNPQSNEVQRQLIIRIDEKLKEDKSKLRGPVSG